MGFPAVTPRTWVSGELVTASIMNAHVRDQFDAIGRWNAITFSAGNFTGSGAMTWTLTSPDAAANRYRLLNKSLRWQGVLATTTVGGTPSTALQIAIPTGNFASTASYGPVVLALDNGTLTEAFAVVMSATVLGIQRKDGANWAASTNATYVYFDIEFELA